MRWTTFSRKSKQSALLKALSLLVVMRINASQMWSVRVHGRIPPFAVHTPQPTDWLTEGHKNSTTTTRTT